MKEKSSIPINQEEITHYLKDIRKLKVMTPERERELAEKMLSGNMTEEEIKDIQKELLEGNLRFVITVSKQYQNQGLDLPDLILSKIKSMSLKKGVLVCESVLKIVTICY